MKRILVTGAVGQIGSELTLALRDRYGGDAVVASDVRMPQDPSLRDGGPFEFVDCMDPHHLTRVMQIHRVDTIYHLAALLSAVGEQRPLQAWQLNVNGLVNVLEAARQYKCALFFPSSIGAFGPDTPRKRTPQVTIQRPTTMYGVTKVVGEMLCEDYHRRFAMDTRGLRFPGLISYQTEPGGGTTDYAVEIFRQALQHGVYTCYLRADARLPMMYMPDAIRAMIELMEVEPARLIHRNAYNLGAVDFTPAEIAEAIKKRIPAFHIEYAVDPRRQAIADSWPESVDDSAAREEWKWAPRYGLDAMVDDMLQKMH
ncbi:MAG: NAD-dependent epimerase/dehydratase family protein [Deltaproteobacteria bacterium]|nr:MAG: NAD-dependent epimerase/dehydratase family protein [Deltaproteobacteria bacterium]TMB44219.1 MAG: NAD-dependent epimerase/dehydratase family protein [Deltaproteobacteria bacterium]